MKDGKKNQILERGKISITSITEKEVSYCVLSIMGASRQSVLAAVSHI